MISLNCGEVFGDVGREVGLKKLFGIRQREMKFLDSLALQAEAAPRAFQQVASFCAILRKEVEVVSGYVDRADKLRRPETHECPL